MATRWVIGAALAIAGCSASDGRTAQDGVLEGAQRPDCSWFDYARCIALLPTQRMRGVWLSGFERSSFLSRAQTMPQGQGQYGNAVWVDFADGYVPAPALDSQTDGLGKSV